MALEDREWQMVCSLLSRKLSSICCFLWQGERVEYSKNVYRYVHLLEFIPLSYEVIHWGGCVWLYLVMATRSIYLLKQIRLQYYEFCVWAVVFSLPSHSPLSVSSLYSLLLAPSPSFPLFQLFAVVGFRLGSYEGKWVTECTRTWIASFPQCYTFGFGNTLIWIKDTSL